MTGIHQSNMCHAKTTESCAYRGIKEPRPTRRLKLRFYEILCNLNQGFEQVLGQLGQLEKLG